MPYLVSKYSLVLSVENRELTQANYSNLHYNQYMNVACLVMVMYSSY